MVVAENTVDGINQGAFIQRKQKKAKNRALRNTHMLLYRQTKSLRKTWGRRGLSQIPVILYPPLCIRWFSNFHEKKKNTIKCRCICLTQTDLQILIPLPSLKWFSVRTAVTLMRCEFIISLIQKICYLSRGNPIIARLICIPQIASWATKFEESTLDIAKLFWVFCNNKVFGPYSSIQVVR